jgi:hypothetical protein
MLNILKNTIRSLMAIPKKLEELSQQLDSVQKAQAHTRGEIQDLRTEVINQITRGGAE